MARPLGRHEGKLFAEGGCLFMVVHADELAGTARVSCRMDGNNQVIDMPLADVTRRLASGGQLALDNLNGPESRRRLHKNDDGWYFSTREGPMGPWETEDVAARQLGRHILRMQADAPTTGATRPSGIRSRRTGPSERRARARLAAV